MISVVGLVGCLFGGAGGWRALHFDAKQLWPSRVPKCAVGSTLTISTPRHPGMFRRNPVVRRQPNTWRWRSEREQTRWQRRKYEATAPKPHASLSSNICQWDVTTTLGIYSKQIRIQYYTFTHSTHPTSAVLDYKITKTPNVAHHDEKQTPPKEWLARKTQARLRMQKLDEILWQGNQFAQKNTESTSLKKLYHYNSLFRN